MIKILLLIWITLFIIIATSYSSYAQGSGGVEIAGDILQYVLPAAGGVTALAIGDYQGLKKFAFGFGTQFGVTQILKYSVNEPRPNGGVHSFPSGHTAAAFYGAAFIQRRYGWKYGAVAYALAYYVGFSRVYAKKHHYWDVLAGAALGIGSAYLFTKPYKKRRMALVPSVGYGGIPVVNFATTF